MSAESRTWADMITANPNHSQFYIDRFKEMEAEGRDLHGEARLIDAMAERGSRILDAGCGPGRVGGYLASLGHSVVGVDLDPVLVNEAKTVFPDSTWLVGDLAELSLTESGLAGAAVANEADEAGQVGIETSDVTADRACFDLIVSTGNVFPFIAEGSRRQAVASLAAHLKVDGRLVIGFGGDRGYSFEQFFADAKAAGLATDLAVSTWDLRPFREDSDFLVAVFSPDQG